MKHQESYNPICGCCWEHMELRLVAPCLDCWWNSREIVDWENNEHEYWKIELFNNHIFCDFCDSDVESEDPWFWWFPYSREQWRNDIYFWNFEKSQIKPSLINDYACPKCHMTNKKQKWIYWNAKKNDVILSTEYWPFQPKF